MAVTVIVECRSEAEAAALRHAAAFVAEMHSLAQTTPDGQVLHACEAHALNAGRDLLRFTLQQAAQTRVDAAEEKGAPHAAAARAPALATARGGTAGT